MYDSDMIPESVDRLKDGLVIAFKASWAGRRRPRPADSRLGHMLRTHTTGSDKRAPKSTTSSCASEMRRGQRAVMLKAKFAKTGHVKDPAEKPLPARQLFSARRHPVPQQRNIALGASRTSPLDAPDPVERLSKRL